MKESGFFQFKKKKKRSWLYLILCSAASLPFVSPFNFTGNWKKRNLLKGVKFNYYFFKVLDFQIVCLSYGNIRVVIMWLTSCWWTPVLCESSRLALRVAISVFLSFFVFILQLYSFHFFFNFSSSMQIVFFNIFFSRVFPSTLWKYQPLWYLIFFISVRQCQVSE